MKSKKRHQSSSEESEQSDDSVNSSSSSESDSEDSSESEHRHKKKKKRANPSNSDSASEDQRRSKKRKHKKKKKKHSKKKRRSHSEDLSASDNELSSVSDGEVSPKKKRKHKHKHYKRNRSLPDSDIEEVHGDRRLHSVVKERRDSSEGSQPSRTYYQKEYPREEYEREREVQRFYRGSSKELRQHQEPPYYDRERNDRYGSYPQEKYDRNKEKYGNNSHYNVPNEDFNRRQHEFDQYKRHQRYNEHRYQEEYSRRPREDNNHPREDTRGYRYNQYEGQKRREYDEGREYRERGPPENVNYRDRAYPDKREKYRDDGYSQERPREPVRRERPTRPEKPLPPPQRGHSRSRSPDGRFREKRIEIRSEKEESRPIRDRPREDRVREDRPREERPREEKPREERLREERPREERPREERPREDRRAPATENKPRERKTRFGDANDKEYSWGKEEVKKEGQKDPADKEKPNFGLSGKLTADQNTVNGVVIKYSEPDDAKQPKRRWRFYPFKGDKAMPILYIHRQSAFLIGRDKKVADIALDHPSISKQHAALQYRATPFTRPDGSQGRRVRPYIIDLESANGTFVNNKKIEPRRYVELLERDVVKFGFSQREYVLLHENSKDEAQDDDHIDPPDIGDNITTTEQIKQEKRVKQEVAEDGE